MAQFPLQNGVSRVVVTRLLIAALLVAAVYLVFEFGRIRAGYDVVKAAEMRGELKAEIDTLEERIGDLNEQIAVLETHREIDREAYADVEASLAELQAKIQGQTDEIAFYRGIISPKDGAAGLRVQDLKLSRGREERMYNVRLVLVQSLKHDRKVSGDVNLTVEGTEGGAETSYAYAQLLPESGNESWAFSFRYFQDFDREIVLPDGFTPERINIEVRSRTRSIASIEESFAWTSSPG